VVVNAVDDAPLIVSISATAVSGSGATLMATVAPNFFATEAWFEYGTTIAYGLTLPAHALGNGTEPVDFQNSIGGLMPHRHYYFRLTATNSDGNSVEGGDFTTVNASPDAQDDTVFVAETAVTIPVLENDTDPDGDSLSLQSVTSGSLGTVQVSGTVAVYTPPAGFSGTDAFTYTVSDGYGGQDTAAVTVLSFARLAGYYSGLVQTSGSSATAQGLLNLTLSSQGSFTGKLKLREAAYAIVGNFDAAGTARVTGSSGGQTVQIALTLSDASGGQVTGGVTDTGGASYETDTRRDPYSAASPAPQKGRYTILLPPDPAKKGIANPQGYGYAVLDVKANGTFTLAGYAGNGLGRISESAALWPDRSFPFYAGSERSLAGVISGRLVFDKRPGSDCAGVLTWRKAKFHTAVYPNGFSQHTMAIGCRFIAPKHGHRALDFRDREGRATVRFEDGGIAGALNRMVHFSLADVVTVGAGIRDMKVSRANGTFTGHFEHPRTHQQTLFRGILYQKQNLGGGSFAAGGLAGAVKVLPQ
jgi:hypothetical protein